MNKSTTLGFWSKAYFLTFKLVIIAGYIASSPSAFPRDVSKLEAFNIKAEPTPADWAYFLKMPRKDREALWTYNAKQHYQLKDWSWGWRLGWVRVCGHEKTSFCIERFSEALKDRALVVRADAATKMGDLYEGSGDAKALALLENAFKNPRNMRNGKPMFVQQRILEAVHKISGDKAAALGQRLAKGDPSNLKYWNQISRF